MLSRIKAGARKICGGALVAIHSELPNEQGLELWINWSKQDAEYADDWEQGDPCADRWSGFEAGKGIGFGTLVRIADEFDPKRVDFTGRLFEIVQEISPNAQFRQSRPNTRK